MKNEEIARNALRGELWASSKEVKEALVGSVIKALNSKDQEYKERIEELQARLKVLEIHELDRKEWQETAQKNCEENESLKAEIAMLEKVVNEAKNLRDNDKYKSRGANKLYDALNEYEALAKLGGERNG